MSALSRIAAPLVLCLALASAVPAQQVLIDNSDPGFTSATSATDGEVVILMYHGLDAPHGHDPANFAPQMQHLLDVGATSITMDHLVSWIETGSPALPDKPVVITFDDDYITVYTVAYPAMQERGLSGTNFAHTAYVGVPPGGPPPTSFDHADWAEINEMEAAGVLFTESHTVTHRNLTTLSASELTDELADSKAAIEANIPAKTCRHLAYPFGAYNQTVIDEAIAAGYAAAVTTISGTNTRSTPLFELRRFNVTPSTASQDFVNIIAQASGPGGSGEWAHSTGAPGYTGVDYQLAPAGAGEQVASWMFTLPEAGGWEVEINYAAAFNRATDAPFAVAHRDGTALIEVDQTVNGGTWVSLGQFPFDVGEAIVSLSNDANGYVIADAVRMTLVTSVPVGLSLIGVD
jgi:peptidoglycan/xylan/chitin deacetylase (PgdA/CDA1 family)